MIGEPRIDEKPERHYMGIRIQAPFKGMFAHVTALSKELPKWFKARGIEPTGHALLRYHVIDMEGMMDIAYGILVPAPLEGDGRVIADALPAGHYANLIYTGSGLQGNKALIQWARANGIKWDRWDDPKGDGFACRYELYLTDPKIEPRKTKWEIEVAIKITDEQK